MQPVEYVFDGSETNENFILERLRDIGSRRIIEISFNNDELKEIGYSGLGDMLSRAYGYPYPRVRGHFSLVDSRIPQCIPRSPGILCYRLPGDDNGDGLLPQKLIRVAIHPEADILRFGIEEYAKRIIPISVKPI